MEPENALDFADCRGAFLSCDSNTAASFGSTRVNKLGHSTFECRIVYSYMVCRVRMDPLAEELELEWNRNLDAYRGLFRDVSWCVLDRQRF